MPRFSCAPPTYNKDVAAFFTKWMVDVEDAQTARTAFFRIPPRGCARTRTASASGNLGGSVRDGLMLGVIVPFTLWRVYGDRRKLMTLPRDGEVAASFLEHER